MVAQRLLAVSRIVRFLRAGASVGREIIVNLGAASPRASIVETDSDDPDGRASVHAFMVAALTRS